MIGHFGLESFCARLADATACRSVGSGDRVSGDSNMPPPIVRSARVRAERIARLRHGARQFGIISRTWKIAGVSFRGRFLRVECLAAGSAAQGYVFGFSPHQLCNTEWDTAKGLGGGEGIQEPNVQSTRIFHGVPSAGGSQSVEPARNEVGQ